MHTPPKRINSLDGLRLIAVSLVLLFHLRTPHFAAGFIGVDAFFVLSGYLITAGLIREFHDKSRISLSNFWMRRFKRLMPAAILLLVVVMIYTLVYSLPYYWPHIGNDIFWTTIYLGNWHFIQNASYFANDGSASPLLHMWSLSLEEQFYLIWPIILVVLLWLSRRLKLKHLKVLAISMGTMILLSAWLLHHLYLPTTPERAYMGTDTKMFEPLLGALVAILLNLPKIQAAVKRYNKWLVYLGPAIMIFCFAYSAGPSKFYFTFGALVFSIGTSILIAGLVHSNSQTWLIKLLNLPPVAYLGRISYGLYLWHWPLSLWLLPTSGFDKLRAVVVVIATIACAAISYHLVETPIRTGAISNWLSVKRTFSFASFFLAFTLFGSAICGGTPLNNLIPSFKPTNSNLTIALVGDSVPQRLAGEFAKVAAKHKDLVYSATRGGCSPLGPDIRLTKDESIDKHNVEYHCSDVIDLQNKVINEHKTNIVVWWSRHEIADRRVDGKILIAGTPKFWQAQKRDLEKAINRLTQNGRILIFIATERPGKGIFTLCKPDKCHPFLHKMIYRGELRDKWNQIMFDVVKRHPKNTRYISLDNIYCHDKASPCDDSVGPNSYARPDGSHFENPAVAKPIAEAIFNRIISVAK